MDGRHGSWLAVLEKAYGIIRQRQRAKKGKLSAGADHTAPVETLSGGNAATTISLLTGRQSASLKLAKAARRDEVHNLLAEMTRKHRLICLTTETDKPSPGLGKHHAYAIFDYDVNGRQVSIFNPWGNTFTPKGAAGPANGYPTRHGLFTVPLDEFQQVFARVVYETDRPLAKHVAVDGPRSSPFAPRK